MILLFRLQIFVQLQAIIINISSRTLGIGPTTLSPFQATISDTLLDSIADFIVQ